MSRSILPYRGVIPKIHPSVFMAEGARIIGDVEIGKESSVWFNAVVRGDINFIRIGEETNIQDAAVLHVTHLAYPLIVGSGVTVGHNAVLHAATIKDFCLVGMGAIVLDNAQIGPYALVAAGAVVLSNAVIPEGMMAAGVPAKVIRPLTKEERKFLAHSAQKYVEYAATYRI
jgi:carbonic anhydrase/acetyltransferase-like protein (isoleucine patch superfamily)